MPQITRSGGRQTGVGIPFADIEAPTVDGLLPALDRRVVGKPFAVEGRNFLWDAKGPYSGFGSVYISHREIERPELAQTFRINDDILMFTVDSIREYDPVSDTFWPRFTYTPNETEYPWSSAFVGNRYYFCKKGTGIIEYIPATGEFKLMVNAFFPTDPVGICESRGRLIVLGTDLISNSAQDDANDFEPSLLTGAGNQVLSMIGGTPFGVFAIDEGFLVFTSKGILLATFNQYTNILFIFDILTTQHPAIGPYAILTLDDGLILYISRQGLLTSNGQKPAPFEPLFSEYLARELLANADLSDYSAFRLFYAVDQQLLFLSVESTAVPRVYDYAWCLYRPVGKWGIFNTLHFAFGEFNISASVAEGFNFGYINVDGLAVQLSGDAFVEATAFPDTGVDFRASFDMPARIEDGVVHFPTLMDVDCRNLTSLIGKASGWYDFISIKSLADLEGEQSDPAAVLVMGVYLFGTMLNCDSGAQRYGLSPVAQDLGGLDSYITVGMFRYDVGQYSDQLGIATNLAVGMDEFALQSEIDTDDYLITTGSSDTFEDWLEIDGAEDWGNRSPIIGSVYNTLVIGTNDGTTVFTSAVPETVDTDENTIYYACMVSGLMHMLKFSADAAHEYFHLKSLTMSGTSGGRL